MVSSQELPDPKRKPPRSHRVWRVYTYKHRLPAHDATHRNPALRGVSRIWTSDFEHQVSAQEITMN